MKATSKDQVVKIDEGLEGRTESEERRRRRENSFIRGGYEIYIEGTYMVNGKKKTKIKKKKLNKQMLAEHNKRLHDKVRREQEAGNDARVRQLQKELDALNEMGLKAGLPIPKPS